MSGYLEHLTEDRRLVILRLLKEAPGYSANGSVLHTALARFGHRVSRDQVRGDLAWLEEQGLVKSETIDALYVATIVQRGLDVAAGDATVPGVKRPSPAS